MYYCPRCNVPLPSGVVACGGCGNHLAWPMRPGSWKWIRAGWMTFQASATVGVGWLAFRELQRLIRPLNQSDLSDSAIFLYIWGIVLWLLWSRARWVVGLVWKGINAELELVVSSMGRTMELRASSVTSEEVTALHYGAADIHPGHLVYWICVRSDSEKLRLEEDPALNRDLRLVLAEYGYPQRGRKAVKIGFESQETVDRVSKGDWWRHLH